MVAYILLLIMVFVGSFGNICTKLYRKNTGHTPVSDGFYYVITLTTACTYFAFVSGFDLSINTFTAVYSIMLALLAFLSISANLIAIENTDILNVTLFSNSGAVVLPLLFNIAFLGDLPDIKIILGIIASLASLFTPLYGVKKTKQGNIKGLIMCIMLFFISGIDTVIMKLYSISPEAMSESIFCFYGNVFMIPFVFFLIKRQIPVSQMFRECRNMNKKSILFAVLAVVSANTVTLLSLITISKINLTLYLILSNSLKMLVISLMAMIVFKEYITKDKVLSMLFATVAIILTVI